MTEYNIALVLDERVGLDIIDYFLSIKGGFNVEYGLHEDSIPHMTVLKFESENGFDLGNIEFNDTITLSGVTMLPSRMYGLWVEIPVLKSQPIVDLQKKLLKLVKGSDVKSGIGERFRPHITLCRTLDTKCTVEKFDQKLLRMTDVSVKLTVRKTDGPFEIQ